MYFRDAYLLELCRYIVLNPVRAGMIDDPGQYRWPSFKATAGMIKSPDFLNTDGVLRQFAGTRPKAQVAYRRFVRAGIKEASPWKALKGQCFLGGKEFIEKLAPYLASKSALKEVRIADRKVHRPDLEQLFRKSNRTDKVLRNRTMRTAHFEHGYRQKEIADHLGRHDTTVSNMLRKKS